MLAIILTEDDSFSRAVTHRSRLQKYSVARYRDPVKLADSLPELHPDVLIIRFEDYPLHWELLAAEVLCSEDLHQMKIIVFAPSDIDAEHYYPNLICMPEKAGQADSGRLSQESSRMLSEMLVWPFAAVSKQQATIGSDEAPSRLIAAAEKQTRSQKK
ncbi:MAG TPA: hypothetical protein DIT55_02940 [Spirochaetaceae bacterium]|nr:hypothetical protein [Spirochaetaceae bacterium]